MKIIVTQDQETRAYNIPGYGNGIKLKNLQTLDTDKKLGKQFYKYYPSNCAIPQDVELLTEAPICNAVVESDVVEDIENGVPTVDNVDDAAVSEYLGETVEDLSEVPVLKTIESFENDKDAIEKYGLEFGIDLNKQKSAKNMYKDLVAHVAGE